MEKTAMNQMLEELIAHEWEIPMTLIVKAKELVRVEKDQAFQLFKAGQESMEEGGKSFDQWYETTYGETN